MSHIELPDARKIITEVRIVTRSVNFISLCFVFLRALTRGKCAVVRKKLHQQRLAGVSRAVQCVAVCCSVLQCVAVCCSVLQCVAVCCSVLQCDAVYCSVLQCVAVCCTISLGLVLLGALNRSKCIAKKKKTFFASTTCCAFARRGCKFFFASTTCKL